MIIYKEYMSVSLLNAAKFRCDDFECVAENVNQWLALTHLGPGRRCPDPATHGVARAANAAKADV